jgi:hypothetical protein
MHPKHLHPRRYNFHAHASGVSAHIRRPDDKILTVQGVSALPIIGGHVESDVPATKLDKWVSFDSAHTSAHGDYVNLDDGRRTTLGELAFDQVPTETKVSARVRGLSILGRFYIGDLSLGINSRSAQGPTQPPIRLEGNRIEDVRIDNAKLKVELAESFFCENDTKDKLKSAHQNGLPADHDHMFLPCKVGVEEVKDFPEADGTVKCTIVKKISWDGEPHPKATIHGHVVVVPGFGKVYFGEMFITGNSRRLTLVRFQLGSDDGGEVTAGDGGSTSEPWPPTGG